MSNEWVSDRRVVVSRDADRVAAVVSKRLLSKLVDLTRDGDVAHISLTGGRVGTAVLRTVAAHKDRDKVDWSRVHIWWSDERFVAADDPERNDLQAREALLRHIAVPPANVHAIGSADGGLTAEDAADAYAGALAEFSSDDVNGERQAWPSFDICLLGVGPDAHIASLFPDHPQIHVTDRSVVVVHDSPKPPPVRVTLTRPVINASQRVWLVLTGQEKAGALGLALAGASYASVPAAGAKGRRRTVFFVDEAAASQVPEDLIDPD